MGFDGCGTSNNHLPEEGLTCTHKRSESFPNRSGLEEGNLDDCGETSNRVKLDMGHLKGCMNSEKNPLPNSEVQNSLKNEILQLEKRLQDQVAVRGTLERALGYRCSSHEITNEISIPMPATELIREISVLEVEVAHLEQYLLSLYRKAFDQQINCPSPLRKDDRLNPSLTTLRGKNLETFRADITVKQENPQIQPVDELTSDTWKDPIGEEDKVLDSSVHRCHSSLSQRSQLSGKNSPPQETLGKALRACHSQPLSLMEYAQNTSSNIISLAEHLGTRISDHVPDTPNKLSEDMIKCISAIYCKLADPPRTNHGLSSPTSSLSSINAFSPKDHNEMWSPGFRKDPSSFDVRLDNPFHVQGLKEFSGPYSTMVEVQCIYKESEKLSDVEHMLQNFRSLISRLEAIDPRKLRHEEKLAFWINVHNALVMHAVLAYGIPHNSMKRVFMLLKAAYNIGGHVVSADVIQSSILGCRMSRPGQWFRVLLSSRTKFKAGDERQAYAIERPEPLLHFALSSGCHSDPAVRVYTPKRVFQELEASKEEFIRATFGVRKKDHKILLPKIVDSFAKDAGLCPAGLIEVIQKSLPDSLRKSIKKRQLAKSRKNIEWVPHNFAFRYLISKELVK